MSYENQNSSLKSRNCLNLRLNPISIQKSKELLNFESKPHGKYNNNQAKSSNFYNYRNNPIFKANTYKIQKKKFNINNNIPQKNNNKEKNNLSNAPLNTNTTTRENTLNSANSRGTKKHDPLLYVSDTTPDDSSNTLKGSDNTPEQSGEKKPKSKIHENEDTKFLYKIFYDYSNSVSNNLSDLKNKKNKFNLNELRQYLIKNEKNFKNEGNILLYQSSKASGLVIDFYFIKKMESLIARYSLVIFIFIQCERIDQAKNIFLLMLKENKIYIDYIEKKIMEYYSIKNKKINLAKEIPRMTYELIRIYSFIIKYSQYFNMMNYRNIFLGHYFQLLYFIYDFFIHKGNNRMFNLETKNQLNYWFSFALHNVSYYSALNYFPLNLTINLSNYIINLYYNLDDNILTDSEKSLIIKTLYNLGLFYYLNGKKDEALLILDKAKERITNSEDENLVDTSFCQMNVKKKDSINLFLPKTKKIENSLFSNCIEEHLFTNKLSTNNSSENIKNNGFTVNKNNDEENSKKEKKGNIIERITQGFHKKKNDLEDIKLLIHYGVKNGLISDKNMPENENKNKYRKIFRGSHINLSTTFRVKDFLIPYYFNNPLLRKIELLMGEIELDKKKYNSAYSHVLRAFYILISLKINRTSGNQRELHNEQRIIDKYLTLIEKYKDEEIKKNERENLEQNVTENINVFSPDNSNNDSFIESLNNLNNNEISDKILDKYNLVNDDETEEKDGEENQEILVCGKKILDEKTLKEIEKFFLFLSSLSLFQIKILNETQPDNKKRNDLPILFPSQFKDCLSNIQRIKLDSLQTMALSRFVILKNPDKWIMPNNLNIDIINKNKLKEYEKKHNRIYHDADEIECIPLRETKEFKYYQKLILSEKVNKEIREFINMNFDLVIKILKQSSEEEIKNILNFPYIIIDPVKNFKKKRKKKKLKKLKEENNYEISRNNGFWPYKDNYDYDYDDFEQNFAKGRLRTYTTNFKKSNKFITHCFLPEKQIKGNYFEKNYNRIRNRNKSVYNNLNFKLGDSSDDNIKDKKDYNDSYEDYLISPECSLDHK